MTGKTTTGIFRKLTASLFLIGTMLSLPPLAQAGLVELPGLAYDVTTSMADNLKAMTGKKVHVTLTGGTAFTGTVKAVGNELLHLDKLEGKEYFDALIRVTDIEAIDTRFRDYQP